MSAMDSVAAESDIADTPPHAPNAASHLNCTIPIRCPDRPIKKGRPANSSLKSWNDEQKRKQRDSTDEENPRGGKTRLLAQVM
jgi:hypothetical protein